MNEKTIEFYNEIERITKNVKSDIRASNQIQFEKLKEEMLLEFQQSADQIFLNMDFIKQLEKELVLKTDNILKHHVKNNLNEEYFFNKLVELIEEKIKDKTQNMIKSITKQVIDSILCKYKEELKTTKSLCYSIDSEIRHTMMSLPISPQTEEIAIKKITELLENTKRNIEIEYKEIHV